MRENIDQPDITRKVFVGRSEEMGQIHQAISDKGTLKVVNIQGAGGMGKTSILREVQKRFAGQDDLILTELIDFYDIAINTQRGFMDEVFKQLKAGNIFNAYVKARDKANEIELAGITGTTLTEAKEDILKYFQNCYNELSNIKKIVLLIDTFEIVQDLLGEWLADLLNKLENTTIIVAGRRNNEWEYELVSKVGKESVIPVGLKEFNKEDTEALFALSEAGRIIGDEEREKIQILSSGRPILLTLSLDWHYHKQISIDGLTEKSKEYTLNQLKKAGKEELAHIQKSFSIELVQRFKKITLPHQAINYMALIYKYFTVDTLAYLMESSVVEAQALLNEFVDWSFIKYDERTDSYFIHDLVRELISDYVWPEIDISGEDRKIIYKQIVEFYDTLLDDIARKVAENQLEKEKNKEKELEVRRNLMNLKMRRQHFEIHQVYYYIRANEKEGILRYLELFTRYVWSREHGIIKLLEQERNLAIKEIDSIYPEHYRQIDEARKHIVISEKFDEGLEILNSLEKEFPQEKNIHFYSAIFLYQGIANSYKSNYIEAENKFKKSINILEEEGAEELQWPYNQDDIIMRRTFRCFMRTYGNMGYAYMMTERLSEAIGAYKKALHYCVDKSFQLERASYLNELAFVYTRLREHDRAKKFWKEGLRIREQLHIDYHIALSKNTRGMMEYFADNPEKGKKYSQEALGIFQRINEIRGTALANRALGAILARIGQIELSEETLNEAEDYLLKAENIFKESGPVSEPTYLAETHNMMGLLYYHRLEICQKQGKDIKPNFKKAEEYFSKALTQYMKSKSSLTITTIHERLSKLYFKAGDAEKAQQHSDNMEKIILQETGGKTYEEIYNTKREYLYPIGKSKAGKARILFKKFLNSKNEKSALLNDAAKHYALACACLEMFSKDAFGSKYTFDELSNCFKNLNQKERDDFKKQIMDTLSKNNLKNYSEILKRIEDAEIIF
ncbi:MAG: ATP-binding protein [Desulfobacterales bacterium]|nr:ATP-binding protein [Desulfobacterales bacterium]